MAPCTVLSPVLYLKFEICTLTRLRAENLFSQNFMVLIPDTYQQTNGSLASGFGTSFIGQNKLINSLHSVFAKAQTNGSFMLNQSFPTLWIVW